MGCGGSTLKSGGFAEIHDMKGRADLNGKGCTVGEKKPDGRWAVVVAKTEEKLTLKEENLKPTAKLLMPAEAPARKTEDGAGSARETRRKSDTEIAMDNVLRRKSLEVGTQGDLLASLSARAPAPS